MTPEQRREYNRNWRKSPQGRAYTKRRIEQRRTQYGGRRGIYACCEHTTPKVRYGPLVNWGASRGRVRQAGASFALHHQ